MSSPTFCAWHADATWVASTPPVLAATPATISLATGGQQVLSLDAGTALAHAPYLVLGSLSGSAPGFVYGGVSVPLNVPDAYFDLALGAPNAPPLTNSFGVLDATGSATAAFTLPPGLPPALIGLQFQHAYGVLWPSGVRVLRDASNATSVRLVP